MAGGLENLLSIGRRGSRVKIRPVCLFIVLRIKFDNGLSLFENSFVKIVADIIVETFGSRSTQAF